MKRFALALLISAFFTGTGMTAEPAAKLPTAAKDSITTTGRDLCKQNFETYRLRLTKNPDDAAGWQELRVCAELLKRWGEAGLIASELIEKKAQRPEPHLILGYSLYYAKDYPKAVDEFKESIRLNNNQAAAYFQLGLAYLRLSQPTDAVAAGTRAVELAPNNPAYHHQLAFSYYLVRDDSKCEEAAKKAIELDQNDVAAYKILSSLYSRQGRQEMADHMTEEAIHANGRLAAANPFVPDRRVTTEELVASPFEIVTPPSATEIYLKAQWEKMKQRAMRGDVEATAAYYSSVGGVRESYRKSFQSMGAQKMQETFKRLGELFDCDIAPHSADAVCRSTVSGSGGSVLETKVYFEKNPDAIWRIKSF